MILLSVSCIPFCNLGVIGEITPVEERLNVLLRGPQSPLMELAIEPVALGAGPLDRVLISVPASEFLESLATLADARLL